MTNYRTIVTLSSGAHKILRLSYEQVARVVSEVRKFQNALFREVRQITLNGVTLCLNEILRVKFINEYTREELLTIA